MLKTVIIADDLTGANDTGAILAQNGFCVGTVLKKDQISNFTDFDTLCISTDSRAMNHGDAYEAIMDTARLFPKDDSILYSKRIDSTLRGNVGAEIASILDYLGKEYTAVVVASFPRSGRTCIGDILLVGGLPLQITEVSHDPINPMSNSRVTDIIKEQTDYPVGYVGLEKVAGSSIELKQVLEQKMEKNRIVVVDARTEKDIEAIAACCAISEKKIVAVDPGAFTAALADYKFNRRKYIAHKSILCAIGSVSELTRQQITYLKKHENPYVVKMNTRMFFEEETRKSEIIRVAEEIENNCEKYQLLVITTAESKGDLVDFSEIENAKKMTRRECTQIITSTLADTVARVLGETGDTIGGLYASGGDVSVAVSERLNASGFDVRDEVIPLAIYSKIIGGKMSGMPIVTKGGLIGQEDTLLRCIDYLKSEME